MRNNPDQSEVQVFRDLVDKFTSIQRELHLAYRNDRFSRDHLIIGADIPHIQNSYNTKSPPLPKRLSIALYQS